MDFFIFVVPSSLCFARTWRCCCAPGTRGAHPATIPPAPLRAPRGEAECRGVLLVEYLKVSSHKMVADFYPWGSKSSLQWTAGSVEIHREDMHIMADLYGVPRMRDQEWNGNTEHLITTGETPWTITPLAVSSEFIQFSDWYICRFIHIYQSITRSRYPGYPGYDFYTHLKEPRHPDGLGRLAEPEVWLGMLIDGHSNARRQNDKL